jgi:hypothetical protein
MKKIMVLFCLAGTLTGLAQGKFNLGIKVGQNFSSVNNVAADHNAASYHAGIAASFGVSDKFSITPEAVLSQTKLEASPTIIDLLGNSKTSPETYHLNYLIIPVLAQLNPTKNFSIQAGPQYGILLDQTKDGKENAKVAFTSGEFSFVGGAKVDLGGFYLYGRYVIGMNRVASASELGANLKDASTWKTKQWQLGIGMSLFKF